MFQHILLAWKKNRGNLLAVLGSVTGVFMCVIWYFQLLPDVELAPRSYSGTFVNQAPRIDNRIVVTILAPVVVTGDDAGQPPTLHGIVELYAPMEMLEADLQPLRSLDFELSPNRKVAVVFSDLQPGSFSVVVFLDLNENGILDYDEASRPLEPFRLAASPTAPSATMNLEDAAVSIAAGETKLLEFEFRSGRTTKSPE